MLNVYAPPGFHRTHKHTSIVPVRGPDEGSSSSSIPLRWLHWLLDLHILSWQINSPYSNECLWEWVFFHNVRYTPHPARLGIVRLVKHRTCLSDKVDLESCATIHLIEPYSASPEQKIPFGTGFSTRRFFALEKCLFPSPFRVDEGFHFFLLSPGCNGFHFSRQATRPMPNIYIQVCKLAIEGKSVMLSDILSQ